MEFGKEANRNAKEIEGLLMENGELKAKCDQLQGEQDQLQQALEELYADIKKQNEAIQVN